MASPAPGPPLPDASLLPEPVRTRLRDAWLTAALDEHASIGSFARFTLQLLAVGAPPELVAASQRAGIDEIEHARLSFRLASVYAGEPLGPGPLPLDGIFDEPTDLVGVAVATLREGCLEETLAAVAARHAAQHATEPAPRHYLELIAADEARHSELAWATVRWCLQAGGQPVREALVAALDLEGLKAAPAPAPPELSPEHEALLAAHGRPTRAALHGIRARAVDQILGPASEALLRA